MQVLEMPTEKKNYYGCETRGLNSGMFEIGLIKVH
jgi:hypothetical protein